MDSSTKNGYRTRYYPLPGTLLESDAIEYHAVLEITFPEVGKIKETQVVRQNHGVVLPRVGGKTFPFIKIILT